MGDFDDMEIGGGGVERLPKLTVGEYLLEVIENKTIPTKKGKAMVRSFKIVESVGPEALPVGTEAGAKLLYFSDAWVGARVGEYVKALTGATPDNDLASKIFSAENPAKGTKVKARIHTEKSDGGNDYLKYDWRFVAGATETAPATKTAKSK